MIFVVTLVGSIVIMAMDGKADTFPIGNGALIENQPNAGYVGTAMSAGTRQMNGTLWHFSIEYTDSTHRAVLANYSIDNGITWSGFEIIDETETEFGGVGYPYDIHDSVSLSNNSIIILLDLYAYDTADKHELHLLCHWNNSDLSQWEQVTIYSSVTYYPDTHFASMAVNSSDTILIAYERSPENYIHHDKFIPSTRTIQTAKQGGVKSTSNWGPWALVNSTDVFIIAYPYNPGIGQKLYFKKESDWSAIGDVSFGTNYGPSDCIIAKDDTFIYTSILHGGNGWFDVRHWNLTGSGSRSVCSIPLYNTARLGLSNSSTFIIVSNYDYTNDRCLFWSDNYYASSTHWQATQTIYFDETSDVIDYTSWLPHALYPQLKDYQTLEINYTQAPTGEVFIYFCDSDDPTYDFWAFKTTILTWPGIPYWTYDPDWEPPEEPEPEDNGVSEFIDIPCFTSGLIILVIGIFLISMILMALDVI